MITFRPLLLVSAIASVLAGCGDGAAGGATDQSGGSGGEAPGGVSGNPAGGQSTAGSSGTTDPGVGGVGGAPSFGGSPTDGAGSPGTAGTGGGSGGGVGGSAGAGGSGGKPAGMGGSGVGGGVAGTAGAGGGTISNCSVTPVDPMATQQAKNLLCYLYSIYGKQVLSGQQETSWSNPADDIAFYTGNASIKKAPAVLGGDFLYTGTGNASQGTTTTRAQAYWAAGGITMIRYHMGAPPNSDSYDNSMLNYTSAQCVNVVTAGTTENTSYISKLNGIASNLQTLQSAGVPVLLALFHETQQGGWFWWSKCSGAQFITLYKYTYDYLVKTKGLHNLIRLMPFSGSPSAAFYPGKAFVDVTGGDTYGSNAPFTSLYSASRNIGGATIPLALHETGTVPQPSSMFPTTAPWLLWNIWAGYEKDTKSNTMANLVSAYTSNYTITRDEVPNLK
jgi:hypothetical protein